MIFWHLIMFWFFIMNKPNFPILSIQQPFEDYIVNELLKHGKIKTNEFNHVSYYIEQEPNVIMCNPTMIIRGNVEKTDFYNCGVGIIKKTIVSLIQQPIKIMFF